MHVIYFVRHGETVWNVENKICGAYDSPLTAKGHAQARATAEKIKEELDEGRMHIDVILSSPLSRAYDTAQEISNIIHIPVKVEERLREQNFGKWEGTPRNGKDFALAKANFVDSYGKGESMMRMAQRIYNLLDDLKKDRKHTYLLVAHNGIARIVQSYFFDMTNEEFASFGIANASILTYTFPEQMSSAETK